jgi:hypothetical protein
MDCGLQGERSVLPRLAIMAQSRYRTVFVNTAERIFETRACQR